jgi:hypothetical protein
MVSYRKRKAYLSPEEGTTFTTITIPNNAANDVLPKTTNKIGSSNTRYKVKKNFY